MHEFRVAPEDFIALPRDPAMLFGLAVGLLGDVAAVLAEQKDVAYPDSLPVPDSWGEGALDPIGGLRFASTFFDAFLNARLNDSVTVEFSLLCASAYYLAGNVGSAAVIARHMERPDITLAGGLALLLHKIQGNDFNSIDAPHAYVERTTEILATLGGYMGFDNDAGSVTAACVKLRSIAYAGGTPRELLYADLVTAIAITKVRHAARTELPAASDLSPEAWRPALAKPHFPVELWPAQQRIAAAGLLRGKSAIIQMPTSAGKTRATELIIRSAFLAGRTSLAVIVAPYRSLCHDIRGDLAVAFSGEPVDLDEVSDSYQLDIEFEEIIARNAVLIVTPEKLLYILRRKPELADRIGLVIYDEGHQFDGMVRGPTYELLLTSLKMMLAPAAQIVLISAVIGNAGAVADWLIGDAEAVVEGDGLLPTTKSIAFASWQDARGRLQYVSPEDPEETEFWVPRVISEIALPRRGRERVERLFPVKTDGGDVGLFLGLHLVANGSVAIFCGRKDSVSKLSRRAVEIFDRGVPFASPLEVSSVDEVEKIRNLMEAHLGSDADATQAASIGIFVHHADTPHGLRLSIEYAMKENLAKFVICTSTLAQGVNFPLRYLIVTSTRQGGERILVRDFHNLMGRAGRAGMHTEGSIIFSTPTVFDQRDKYKHRWRWDEAKMLLDARNAEPTKSSILALLDDYEQRMPGAPPIVQKMLPQWLDLAFADSERLEQVTREAVAIQPNISANEFRRFVEGRARAVHAIAAFLIANMTFEANEDIIQRVNALTANTLAYHLANEADRQRLVELFQLIAKSIVDRTEEQNRLLIRRSPLAPAVIAALNSWLVENIANLRGAAAENRLFPIIADKAIEHSTARSVQNVSDANAIRIALAEWANGRSYAGIHAILSNRDVRVRGKSITLDDTVALCENGFGYDISMIVASIADLAESIDSEIHSSLVLLQRQVKNGLSNSAALAFCEAGFADRVVASALAAKWPEAHDRGMVRTVCRRFANDVSAVLAIFPTYFTGVANELKR